ncbi:hypothetical protein [Microbacterium sp. CJ88]|uniref:hypothetical protein n=1 Tax=Microbacterium sp. CJ88 TaxID=3445672 RepID=UPI003F660B59
MPDFDPARSDAIREGLIQHVARQSAPRLTVAESRADRRPAEPARPRARRHRTIQWVTAVTALVVAGGAIVAATYFARDAFVVGPPAASPTSSVSPAPSPSPTSTPTPSATPASPPPPAPDPADPMNWIVSQKGMGPLVLGMPFSAAIAAVPQAEDACGHAYSIRPGRLFFARWGAGVDDPLDVAAWARADGPHTVDGIGIGSTIDEVLAAYPYAVEVIRQGRYLQAGAMFFRVETGLVDEIGVTSGDIPWEYCG